MIRRRFAVAALALVLAAAVLQWLPTAAAAQEQMVELLRSDLKSEKRAVLRTEGEGADGARVRARGAEAQTPADLLQEVREAMDTVTAARFARVERQRGLLIDLQIAAEMPLVEKPVQWHDR